MQALIIIIVVLIVLFTLSYLDYKLYDSKKVPKGTPDIVQDIKNGVKKKRENKAFKEARK
ncbi:hypothetical protein [Acholeplasma palmae]|uniref:hypothetical protein n=1 Tax=Acholeplasma palmae TaxID=38986 RepID=UPI0005F9B2C6|nr:hypothetical protein [Alteracholeplasma palmae]